MEKIKNIDWIALVLVLLGLRSVYEVSFPQALIVLCFSVLFGVLRFLKSKEQKDIDQETRQELERIKANLSALVVKGASKPQETGMRFF